MPGEVVWRVPSLPIADDGTHEADAIRLFVERARAVRPGFAVSDGNAAATVEVCRRLDGIPLAIELAAAWVNTLSVQEIAARLVDRFDLLAGGGRTALPRQQTLKGTLDWSYGLLTDAQRLALRRLSVFEGGWTLEAAEAVCAAEAIQAADVLGLLAALVSKSLVLADPESVPARYRLLETTRQYALELLDGSDASETRRRHADYFRSLAHRAQPQLLGPRLAEWMRGLDPEVDNIRAALRWTAERHEADAELDIVASLWDYWWMRGRLSEGQRHLEGALARYPVEPTEMRCRATHGAGLLAAIQGDLGGRARLRHSHAGPVAAHAESQSGSRPV